MDHRYEEALERARKGMPIDEVFPELKESEDERIRKTLLRCCDDWDKGQFGCMKKEDITSIRAYLERQKEQKPVNLDEDVELGLDRALQIIKDAKGVLGGYQTDDGVYECDHAIQTLEGILKNGIEQQPAEWMEKRKKECPFRRNLDNNLYGCERYEGVIYACDGNCSWVVDYPKLKEIQDKREQQPAKWSEEDENLFDLLHTCVCRCINDDRYDYAEREKISRRLIPFIERLKSLRPRPQHKDTYYDIIHNILDMLKDMDFMKITPEHRVSLLNDIRVKCKNADECASILDEPHWKPSEKQMKALKNARYMMSQSGDYYDTTAIIDALITDLQKLL